MTEAPHGLASESRVGIVADVVTSLARLVKGELALARAEAERSLRDATNAVAKLIIAAILGITALNVLAGAAVAGLVAIGLPALWASVIVGVILLLVAVALMQIARGQISPSNLAPKRSLDNLRQDAETLKSKVNPGATADLHPQQ
jgi:CBS domain containing-hemolysin-like protein